MLRYEIDISLTRPYERSGYPSVSTSIFGGFGESSLLRVDWLIGSLVKILKTRCGLLCHKI